MKKSLQLTVLLFTAILFNASAYSPDSIGVKKADGKNYLLHRIENSEGWYTIARLYGVSYADLRLANKDSSDKLIPGRTLLVPLDKLKANDPHFQKNYTQGSDDLFYTVKEGETLFGIAKKFQTNVDSVKTWNHLATGDLKYGQKLKVGYKSKQLTHEPDTSAKLTIKKSVLAVSDSSSRIKRNAETTDSKDEKPVAAIKPDTSKLLKRAAANPSRTKPSTADSNDSTRIIKTASVLKDSSRKIPATNPARGRKEVNETGVASWIVDDDINPNKYYALHRSAPIGTIIKVTNKMNSKYVFVKVVGQLPDTGDNTDLVIKISKASAEKLGVRDSRFQSLLNYGVIERP